MKGKKALLASALFLSSIVAYNCGGGGGGGTTASTTPTTSLSLYITDAPVDPASEISLLETTVYEVYLCPTLDSNAGCVDPVQVFSDPNGVTVDLTNLEDVLHFIDTSQVPEGTYQGLMVVISQTGNIVYKDVPGTYTITPSTTDQTRVECTGDKCSVVVAGAIQPALQNKIAVDFSLKQFSINCEVVNNEASCTIDKLVVNAVPVTNPAQYGRFEMYGLVDPNGVSGDTFTVEWKGLQFKAQVQAQTACELNLKYYGGNGEVRTQGTDCLTQLRNQFQNQNQVCLELYVEGDPANADQTLNVIYLETTNPKKCGLPSSSDDYYALEVKGSIQSVDAANGTFTLQGYLYTYTVEVTEYTYCEFDDYEEDRYDYGTDCFAYLAPGMVVEVKGYVDEEKSDLENGQVYLVASKVEYDDYDEDDYYEESYNENENYNDNENTNSSS